VFQKWGRDRKLMEWQRRIQQNLCHVKTDEDLQWFLRLGPHFHENFGNRCCNDSETEKRRVNNTTYIYRDVCNIGGGYSVAGMSISP
jgi:hypothetical protein